MTDLPTVEFSEAPTETAFVKPNANASKKPSLADKLTAKKTSPLAAPKPAQKKSEPAPPYPKGGFIDQIESFYTMIGITIAPVDEGLSDAFIDNAHVIAEKWDKLAKNNATFRRILVKWLTTSDVGEVILSHAPIFVAAFALVSKGRESKRPLADVVSLAFRQNGKLEEPEEDE